MRRFNARTDFSNYSQSIACKIFNRLKENQDINNDDIKFKNFGLHNYQSLMDYQIIETIGKGSFSDIYKVTDTKKLVFAMKKTSNPANLRRTIYRRIKEITKSERGCLEESDLIEFLILKNTNQENIIKLYDSFVNGKYLYILLEYIKDGKIITELKSNNSVDITNIKKCAYCLCSAVLYLHNNYIVHRDIKPSNVLLKSDGNYVLCDFGSAVIFGQTFMELDTHGRAIIYSNKIFPDSNFRSNITLFYAPPEFFKLNKSSSIKNLMNKTKRKIEEDYQQLNHHNVSCWYSFDIWSIGLTLFCYLTGHLPFKSTNFIKFKDEIFNYNGFNKSWLEDYVNKCDFDDCYSFFREILHKNWKHRTNLSNVLNCDWIK